MERAHLARLLETPEECHVIRDIVAGPPAVVCEPDPARFMPAFAAAVAGSGPVFLADPAWGDAEHAVLDRLIKSKIDNQKPKIEHGWLCVPTGGSSGRIRFARHDQDTLLAAVGGFTRHFGVERVNAVGVLPLHHVSGLMGWMRCVLTGGAYRPWPWDELAAGWFPVLGKGDWFLSLVPTQLQRLLGHPATLDWLRQFRAIALGGGPVWPGLAEAAAQAGLPVSLGYGLTETAAMITAQHPEDFPAGDRSAGPPMPHAQVRVDAQGAIVISGGSVFRGYWPEWSEGRELVTADLGRIDSTGRLHVLGRSDAVINTGGKKVQPEEVEAALRATGRFSDVAVVGVPDPEWGELVVACHPADAGRVRAGEMAALLGSLAPHKRPKLYLAFADWPQNEQGKVNRAALKEAAPGLIARSTA
jgi:O-succinylbenzoic acid--CoA ligase